MDLIQILAAGVRMRASDVHLSAGCPPMARIDGDIVEIQGFGALDAAVCKAVVYAALLDEQRARFEREYELDCSLAIPGLGRFRMNVLSQRRCVEAVLRVVPVEIPTPEQLGLGPIALGLAELPRGLVLVTGPTGSGKSTTLACLIDHINRRFTKHIVTIEDPIEFAHPHRRSLVRQREVGTDSHSFSEALRHALREDPDVILIGEMRDLETIQLALTAAETGHLCFATLHTMDAATSVDRVIDVFPPHQQDQVRNQLSNSLQGVISQILLTRTDGRGRIAAREMMLVTPAIAALIRERKTHQIPNAIETSGRMGMYTLDKALSQLVRRRAISLEDAVAKARSPDHLAALCGSAEAAA